MSYPTPPSRPQSPVRPELIHRPPSRSEHLLRDTLRRADEYERTVSRSRRAISRGRPTRSRADSYIAPVGDPYEFNEGELDWNNEEPGLRRRVSHRGAPPPSLDFLLRPNSPDISTARSVVRKKSSGESLRSRTHLSRSPPEASYHLPYGSPSSPSPGPPRFLRTRTAPVITHTDLPTGLPPQKSRSHNQSSTSIADAVPRESHHQHHRSHHSMPNVMTAEQQSRPRRRPSHSSSHSRSHSRSHSGSVSGDSSPRMRPLTISPHEAVLRARLEGVLLRAGAPGTHGSDEKGDEKLNHSNLPFNPRPKLDYVGEKRSMPGPSVNAEWTNGWGVGSPDSMSTSPPFSGTGNGHHINARWGFHPSVYSERTSKSTTPSPHSPAEPEPITPPPSPPFNAQVASEACRRIDGYVSFASIEGLGLPSGIDLDESGNDEANARKWAKWLRVWPFGSNVQDGDREQSQNRHTPRLRDFGPTEVC